MHFSFSVINDGAVLLGLKEMKPEIARFALEGPSRCLADAGDNLYNLNLGFSLNLSPGKRLNHQYHDHHSRRTLHWNWWMEDKLGISWTLK